MSDLEQCIADWRREMFLAGIQSPEVLDELEGHLRERIDRLKGGLSESDAFQTAAQQLGETAVLKKEFAKTRRWFPRDNPPQLNLLAAWYILAGLNVAAVIARFMTVSWLPGMMTWSALIVMTVMSLFGFQIWAGIGLLRRHNFWRYGALVFAILAILSDLSVFSVNFWVTLSGSGAQHAGRYFILMGMMVPMNYQWLTSLGDFVLMLWAVWFLTRRHTRELFTDEHSRQLA